MTVAATHHPYPPRRTARGFTLVELLVAVALGVLIAVATTAALTQLFRARSQSRAHQQAFVRADTAAARIAMDLATVLRSSDPIQQKVGVTHMGGAGAERDELLMLVNSQRPLRGVEGEAEGDEYEVQYRVMPTSEGQEALWRRMDIAHDEYIDGGGIATPIAGNIQSLSVQATDQSGDWINDSDSDADGLPHAVKVMVTALSDDGHATATAVRVVSIDRVPIPPPAPATDDTNTDSSSDSSGTKKSSASKSSSGTTGGGFTRSTPATPGSTTPPATGGGGTRPGGTGGSGGRGTSGGGGGGAPR